MLYESPVSFLDFLIYSSIKYDIISLSARIVEQYSITSAILFALKKFLLSHVRLNSFAV